jgi:hypothetical protein
VDLIQGFPDDNLKSLNAATTELHIKTYFRLMRNHANVARSARDRRLSIFRRGGDEGDMLLEINISRRFSEDATASLSIGYSNQSMLSSAKVSSCLFRYSLEDLISAILVNSGRTMSPSSSLLVAAPQR